MTRTARRNLAKTTKMINRYKRVHHALRYSPTVYRNVIKETKKGRVATKYGKRFAIIRSKKAALYNIRHVRLVK